MKIYCSGIGGIGLSAYASLMNHDGHAVQGSDRSASALIDDLKSQGIDVALDQSGTHVPEDAELFVYSEAIPETAPERVRAKELGIRQISYPHAVGELSATYNLIAVCGTHGKSSTTAMAARVLMELEKDPTIIVGTKVKELDGRNWRKGKSDLFLLEACEYRKSFHFYKPSIILLTTCDGDHFDYYASMEEYQQAYVDFIKALPEHGVVITHMQDEHCKNVALESGKTIIDADLLELPELSTPGMHMRKNAQLVVALATHLGLDESAARESLKGYAGSWRRLEVKGERKDGVTVIDDYGHHPAEIRATVEALVTGYPNRRIVCVFQPHTHDRTLKLYQDFCASFKGVGELIITSVYDARHEIESGEVDPEKFAADIAKKSAVNARFGGSLKDIESLLPSILQKGDVLLCLGAGDITDLAETMSL